MRDLPPLLHFADDSTNASLGEQRQAVVQSCSSMTQFARTLVRSPDDQSLGPQILDSVASLSDNIRRFVEMLHRPAAASTSHDGVYAQLQRLEAMLRTRQSAKPPVDQVKDVMAFQPAISKAYQTATQALHGITGTLASPNVEPGILGDFVEKVVLAACSVLDMCDQLFDKTPMRATIWTKVHSLTLAITPLCEPATKEGHSDAVTASLMSVRSIVPTLVDAIGELHGCTEVLFESPEELERATLQRQESFGHTAGSSSLSREAEEAGYVEVSAANRDAVIPRMNLAITVCSRSAFDTVDDKELNSGDIMDFEDIQTNATVSDIKALVALRCDIPESEQDVVIHHKVLPNRAKIKDCRIGEEDLLFLFDRREVGNMAEELGMAEIPLYDDSLSQAYTMGAVMRQASFRKTAPTIPKGEDLKRDEEHRIALMNLVKQGRMTVDEAVNQVKDSPSAAAKLLVQANRKILQESIDREDASNTYVQGFYANHDTKSKRPSKKRETVAEVDQDDMSIAGFTATSANRKFGLAGTTKTRPLFLKEGYLNKEGGSRKNWRTRWFVLTSLELSYFKSPADKTPVGVLVLENFADVDPVPTSVKQHCFAVSPKIKESRTYLIQASNEAEVSEWISAIRLALPGRRSHEERLLVLQECIDDLLLRGSETSGIFKCVT